MEWFSVRKHVGLSLNKMVRKNIPELQAQLQCVPNGHFASFEKLQGREA